MNGAIRRRVRMNYKELEIVLIICKTHNLVLPYSGMGHKYDNVLLLSLINCHVLLLSVINCQVYTSSTARIFLSESIFIIQKYRTYCNRSGIIANLRLEIPI